MDFAPSDRVAKLRARLREFIDTHVMPVEVEAVRALKEEVRPGVAYPTILVELRERAREEGLRNAEYGTREQKERWLGPLLNDHPRSCFAMTEPETSGSDPTGLAASARLDDGAGEWIIDGAHGRHAFGGRWPRSSSSRTSSPSRASRSTAPG